MFDVVCEVPEFISSSLSLCLLSLTRFPASLFGWPLLQLFDNLYFSSSSFIINQSLLIVALVYQGIFNQGIFKNLIFVCVSTELNQFYKECPIHFKNHNKEAITGGIVLDLTAKKQRNINLLVDFCISNMKT